MKKKGICVTVFAALLLCVAAFAVLMHTVRQDQRLLFWAADRNNVVQAWLLIQFCADVNARNAEGKNALMFAAET